MDKDSILSKIDHTLLDVDATENDIKKLCNEGLKFKTASICIAPSFVKFAKEYTNGKLKICTVVGFPNGYSTTQTKIFETENAIKNGADEIDMVINIGKLKENNLEYVENEINAIKKVCKDKILKVIIETCKLSEKEKIKMCEIVSKCKADFIKTSTGFSESGAKLEDIVLFKKHLNPKIKIKAAGGIKNLEDAENFINLGVQRLGTSKIVKIFENELK